MLRNCVREMPGFLVYPNLGLGPCFLPSGLSGTLRRLYISAQFWPFFCRPSAHLFSKLSYCTVSHGDLSCRGPLGLFLLKYLCSLSLAFSSHEILFLFEEWHTHKIATYRESNSNRTTSWNQQKNCNNLRLLLCVLFTTKTLYYVHHRQCGRCLFQLLCWSRHKYWLFHEGCSQIARIHHQSVSSRSATCVQD